MSYIIKDKAARSDIRLPLAVMLTLFLQIAAALIWAAKLDTRVGQLEKHTEPLALTTDRLSRIEERMDGLRKDNDQIKRKLDSLSERLMK